LLVYADRPQVTRTGLVSLNSMLKFEAIEINHRGHYCATSLALGFVKLRFSEFVLTVWRRFLCVNACRRGR